MLITILSIISFSIIFTQHITPLEYIKSKIGLSNNSKMYSTNTYVQLVITTLRKLLNCSPCFSFWLSYFLLGMSFESFKLALIIYIITYFVSQQLNKIYL